MGRITKTELRLGIVPSASQRQDEGVTNQEMDFLLETASLFSKPAKKVVEGGRVQEKLDDDRSQQQG